MTYSISDLEQLSGVQVHTIRVWERRYHALEPERSAGNTRLYNDDQLKRLLNIVSLSESGLKISHVCSLSDQEMNQLLDKELEKPVSPIAHYELYISQLLKVGLEYNENEFDGLITKAIEEYGLKDTYINVMYPLLVRLGLMWRIDNICPAQEHFLSNIIRRKISAAIDELKQEAHSISTWVLFLPEDEDHDIGLLFAHYLLKQAGHKVIYLGGKVPTASVQNVVERVEIDHLLLFMVRSHPNFKANDYLLQLGSAFPKQTIHIAGNSSLLANIPNITNLKLMKSIADLETQIKMNVHGN
jgi:DNA-binding transcriptional MerR regulator